jgi:hypothetical protein
MTLLANVIDAARVALLPLAAALLLEELTYGGLVRLLLAPKPGAGKHGVPCGRDLPLGCKPGEPNHQAGGGKCSR